MSQTMYKLGRRVRTFLKWFDNHYYKFLLTIITIMFIFMVMALVQIANNLYQLDVYINRW